MSRSASGSYLDGQWVHRRHTATIDGEVLPIKETAAGVVAQPYMFSNENYETCSKDFVSVRKSINSHEDTIRRFQAEGCSVEAQVGFCEQPEMQLLSLQERQQACKLRAILQKRLVFGDDLAT